jgi:hypothetical protein
MRKRSVSSMFVIGAVCAAFGLVVFAGGAQAAVRHFDATVVAKNSAAKTVQVRTESGAMMSFKVTAGTKFERIGGGFSGLKKGLAIEIDATNASGRWVATQIESASSGGGGNSGGDDHGGGGHDDGPNHT